jgi:hypothetical protein
VASGEEIDGRDESSAPGMMESCIAAWRFAEVVWLRRGSGREGWRRTTGVGGWRLLAELGRRFCCGVCGVGGGMLFREDVEPERERKAEKKEREAGGEVDVEGCSRGR